MSWHWRNSHYGYMAVNTKIFKIPTLNFAFLGRWVGWMFQGKLIHQSIAKALKLRVNIYWAGLLTIVSD